MNLKHHLKEERPLALFIDCFTTQLIDPIEII